MSEVVAPAVTTREVLTRAADLLEEFGWGQGNAIDAEPFLLRAEGERAEAKPGPFCVGTAIQEAASEFGLPVSRRRSTAFAAVSSAVVAAAGVTAPRELVAWNDDPARTKAEVVARLREAAEAAA